MRTIRVLVCPEKGEPHMEKLPVRVSTFREAVGGYYETMQLSENPKVILVCNAGRVSEGKGKKQSLPDPRLFGLMAWGVVGDCFLCGARGENFADLPESMIPTLLRSARENYERQKEA